MAPRTAKNRRPPRARLARIELVAMDFDGVLTDNHVWIAEEGARMKRMWVPDGVGIFLLHKHNIHAAIITGNGDTITPARAEQLQVKHLYQNVRDKEEPYAELRRKLRLGDDQCLFVGDDLPDLGVMGRAGIAVAPSDAHPVVKRAVHWITRAKGGEGCIREVIDALLDARGVGRPRPRIGDDFRK